MNQDTKQTSSLAQKQNLKSLNTYNFHEKRKFSDCLNLTQRGILSCLNIIIQISNIVNLKNFPIEETQRARSQKSLCDFFFAYSGSFSLSAG